MAWEPDYVTAEELGEYLRILPDDDLDAVLLQRSVTTASRAIDKHCRRQFGLVAAPEARSYDVAQWTYNQWMVNIDDLMDTTGMLIDGEPAVLPVLRPRNAAPRGEPWTWLALGTSATEVTVTARWGWTTVPEPVKAACLLQASRLVARRDAPFGIAGSPEAGSEMRLLARIDPDVQVTLENYRRKASPM
jgi:hypothetical protein